MSRVDDTFVTASTLLIASDDSARHDPFVTALPDRWRWLSAMQPRHRTREERRQQQTAQREQRSTKLALSAFAEATEHHPRVLLVRHGEAEHNANFRTHARVSRWCSPLMAVRPTTTRA